MPFRILVIVCILVSASPAWSDEISIAADEWSPYCGKPESEYPGYGIEIAHQIFSAAGHTVVYQIMPWKRAITDTRAGKLNAIIGAYKEEAPDFIFPEEEFGIAKYAFYTQKGNTWRYYGLASLQGIRIGLIRGYSYGEELDALFMQGALNVQYVSGSDPIAQNIKKLLAQRIDVAIANENVFTFKAKQMGVFDMISTAGDPGVSGNLYIGFSPIIAASGEYAQIFTKGMRELKQSGELDIILGKYGLTRW